jgi:hypothetical protein
MRRTVRVHDDMEEENMCRQRWGGLRAALRHAAVRFKAVHAHSAAVGAFLCYLDPNHRDARVPAKKA